MKKLMTLAQGRVLLGLIAMTALLTLAPLPARGADATRFIAVLNAGQEVPPNTSNAAGVAFLYFKGDTLCVALTFGGLTGSAVAAHIHGPGNPEENAAIIFPISATSPSNMCVGPLTKNNRKDLQKGRLYINVHTAAFPGGEIRGQILPAGK